ncbi:MAG: hypothetical protein NTY64_17755, partial [Deltaproteobacteria bacterium]|nr:hypothetical protein [Deltaproteobacteria bacterium]
KSPDGKYLAVAYNVPVKTFWGARHDYYRFSLQDAASSTELRTVKIDPLAGKPPFNMRGDEKIIFWADDSKSVTFKFQGIELKRNVE